jgi:hypothetical protein
MDALVHARRGTEDTRRRQRAEFESTACAVSAGLDGPCSLGMIAVETHRDGAVMIQTHGIERRILRAHPPCRVVHRPKLHQAPRCIRQRTGSRGASRIWGTGRCGHRPFRLRLPWTRGLGDGPPWHGRIGTENRIASVIPTPVARHALRFMVFATSTSKNE